MSRNVKFLIGLAASLIVGWVSHDPLGRGNAFVDELQAGAQAIVADAAIPGVTVQMQRRPLARKAVLSGPANRFQREGQGSLPGLNQRVLAVPGMSSLEWSNPPPQ